MLDIVAALLVLTALLSYVNYRYIGLPTTIGVMVIALVLSLLLLALNHFGLPLLRNYEVSLMARIDFSDVLMQGMLSLLLFAGALHVDILSLKRKRWQVGILAFAGTLVSTFVVGYLTYWLLPLVGLSLPLSYCLLFGTLISPTDPIAVMGILKSAGAPKELEIVISGESLFNDGVGVVLFALMLGMVTSGETPSASHAATLLLQEAGGGIAFGLALGWVVYLMLKSVDNYQLEVLITLAAVIGGYALANHIHVSGPLAMVVVGLLIGNLGRAQAMSDKTRANLDMFWELLDEILNAVLFTLIGLEIVLITLSTSLGMAVVMAILIALTARSIAVGVPILLLPRNFGLPTGAFKVLVWGGLRGGISVALALSLPVGDNRDIVLALTYGVVVFSILAQGLSIENVVKRSVPCKSE